MRSRETERQPAALGSAARSTRVDALVVLLRPALEPLPESLDSRPFACGRARL